MSSRILDAGMWCCWALSPRMSEKTLPFYVTPYFAAQHATIVCDNYNYFKV